MLLNCGVGEDSWESLGLQGVQPVHPKGNQSWMFIGRTDAETKAPIIWSPDAKNWLVGKDPDDGKDWRQEEKGMTEDEIVGCPHQLEGHEFEQATQVGDGQWSLACCSPWDDKESFMTECLNWISFFNYFAQVFYFLINLIRGYFTISWWLLPYINMNQSQVCMRLPHPEPPSFFPLYPIPLGYPRALA